jgi:cytoskeleton protein RodZ
VSRHGKRRTHSHRHHGKRSAPAEPRSRSLERRCVGGAQDLPAECCDDRPDARDPATPWSDDPGAALRAAREARGLSIQDLTRTTKITTTTLVALEHNELDKLPATIFTRGFVKAYAHEVGLNPEATADRYLAQLERDRGPSALAKPSNRPLPAAPRHLEAVHDDKTARVLAAQDGRPYERVVPVAAAVGLAFYIWSFSGGSPPPDEAPLESDTAADAVPAGGQPLPEADATAASADVLAGPLQFELRPQGPCWLSANADGNPVFARLLQAGEHQTIEVRDELVMRVGDPAALSFSINGQSGRALGRPGEAVSVRITKDNFRDFLSS